ncbi:hypothetical protein PG985_006454 [Apiospora marii]|uniref:uncharacterized protein n=1 Tax=Apiospora marii TaxID=335849 RepID=UPI00312F24A5
MAPTFGNSPDFADHYEEKDKDKDLQTTYEFRESDPAETGSLDHGVESANQWSQAAAGTADDEKVQAKKVDLREDGTEYPSGVKLHLIMLAVCLAVFLMALE